MAQKGKCSLCEEEDVELVQGFLGRKPYCIYCWGLWVDEVIHEASDPPPKPLSGVDPYDRAKGK